MRILNLLYLAGFAFCVFWRALINSFKAKRSEKLSVVILNWKREKLLKSIIERYQKYPFIDDIVIWNNSDKDFSISMDKVKVINAGFDHGLDSRYAASVLCNHEHVLFQDDDLIIPKTGLEYLFSEYLSDPFVIHSLLGRNDSKGYGRLDAYGTVDVVLTRGQILNRKYVKDYFDVIPIFDPIRKYTCGNGEDIVMSYVVKNKSGRKNRAHALIFKELGLSQEALEQAIWKRPFHFEIREEIAKKCQSPNAFDQGSGAWDPGLLAQLKQDCSVARWFDEFYGEGFPELSSYACTPNVRQQDLQSALSLLKRNQRI